MNKRMKTAGGILLALLLATAAYGQTEGYGQTARDERYEVAVLNTEKCPIQIVERKTRVANSLIRYPWSALNNQAPLPSEQRAFGRGESQVVYDLMFRNVIDQETVGVAFQWEAFDKEGSSLFKRLETWNSGPISAGRYQKIHQVDEAPTRRTVSYQVSVVLVHLEGFTVNEAAEVLGKAPGTVKSHLHRALAKLRLELGDLREDAAGGRDDTSA